MWLFSYINNKF